MLILVAVTVSYSIKSGLLTKAQDAKKGAEVEEEKAKIGNLYQEYLVEKETGKLVGTTFADYMKNQKIEGATIAKGKDEKIVTVTFATSKNTYTVTENGTITLANGNSNNQQDITVKSDVSYVGCYADVDGNGTVDGVIFVDLMDSENSEGDWIYDSYSYTPVTTAKEYAITSTNYTKDTHFGAHPIISAKTGSTGNDRFYVIALEDLDSKSYYWYKNAIIDEEDSVTSCNFGEGRTNTYNMINKWNDRSYGDKTTTGDYVDMWGAIQNQEKYPITTNGTTGWFVPSSQEWTAFGVFMYYKIEREDKIKGTISNFESIFGLSTYWASDVLLFKDRVASVIYSECCDGSRFDFPLRVRLATTF